jgi:excisionase family DNA binding protein
MVKGKYKSMGYIAQETGLPISYIKKLTEAGQIPALRVGRSYRYDLSSVQTALDMLAAKRDAEGGRTNG